MSDFENQRPRKNRGLLSYLKTSKRYWLIPLLIAALFVALLVGLGSSVFAPFIYPLF